jgi:hypothetical protein
VNIVDPDTHCQVVGLQPGQPLRLRLTKKRYISKDFQLDSQFLFFSRMDRDEQYVEYEIMQTDDTIGKNALSTFFLGEVRLGDKNLILYQNNNIAPYKNTITTFCPKYDSISIKPYQYIEVVLLSQGMPVFEDKFEWSWESGRDGIQLSEVGYRFIYSSYLQNNNVECHPFNMIVHAKGPNVMQHHYWFRCEREVLSLLDHAERGVYLGQLVFKQGSSQPISIVNVFIDLHHRYKTETEQALKSVYTKSAIPYKPFYHGPVCRSISLQEIEFNNLYDGCKTVGGKEDGGVQGETDHNVSHH